MAEAKPFRASSLSGGLSATGIIPQDRGPREELGASREKGNEQHIAPGLHPQAEPPVLTPQNIEQLVGKHP